MDEIFSPFREKNLRAQLQLAKDEGFESWKALESIIKASAKS
jgi:hypothetical protein